VASGIGTATVTHRGSAPGRGWVKSAVYIAAGDEAVAMTMLSVAVERLLTLARLDDDRQVAMTSLDSTNELLRDIGRPLLDAGQSHDVFVALVNDVFRQKVCSTGYWYWYLRL